MHGNSRSGLTESNSTPDRRHIFPVPNGAMQVLSSCDGAFQVFSGIRCRGEVLATTKRKPRWFHRGFLGGESGTDLLSRGIPRTIIGATPFHGPVRDGKEWFQSAMCTRLNLSLCPKCDRANLKEVMGL